MGVSNMKTWLICLALIGIVVMEEVIQMNAGMTTHHLEVSVLFPIVAFSKKLLIPGNEVAQNSLGVEVKEYFDNM
ncbi:hypothetical protein ES332_A07G184300v1 [Gossypium tomentosum]|uniref:Uncharacterized protein n=2 Tax=Gossypium TaxID=3633 RepID=A0A5D2PUM8_GOSTO|nr:hypothetical protein ES332_A07G184300v1 [Gossypium tomentosum]